MDSNAVTEQISRPAAALYTCRPRFPRGRPPTVMRSDSSADSALAVDTTVVEDRGQWAVDIIVVFADGIGRERVNIHRTRERAGRAASVIKRAADRSRCTPVPGPIR